MTGLTLGFAGTPAFGIPCLEALFTSKHTLSVIYTQPDRPAGRGRKLQASAIKTWGEAHHIPVYQPLNFKEEQTRTTLGAFKLDVLIVIAYGLILPQAVLALPRYGCINVHASLLPRWRGASPIQQALLHGDTQTGITIMQMDRGMDTGAILAQQATPITRHDTAQTLHDTLAQLAPEALLATLDALSQSRATPTPQNAAEATYAPKINKSDACINWQQAAKTVEQQVRAFNPWPIATCQLKDTTLRIHQARAIPLAHATPAGTILAIDPQGIVVACGDDALCIETLQLPGARALSVADWLHAGRNLLNIGTVLQ